jgi:ribosomal protein S18 acetylase RimI-like enzyme
VIRTLTHDDFESLYAAFTAAFSDYVVPFAITREQLAEMIARRGWVPELSVGVFDGDAMVAFTVNCVEGTRAYDSGTGVVPGHRRRGLGREVMERSFALLRERCSEYVLEVIDKNIRAVELYRATGFNVTRGLQCWGYEWRGEASEFESGGVASALHRDIAPAWQNSDGSVARARAEHVTIGDENGYAIVFPGNGDLAQLAVRRDARRRGVGTRLLRAAAARAGKPLRILNVDERDAGIAAFLEHNGATRTVRQLEMMANFVQPRREASHGSGEHTGRR